MADEERTQSSLVKDMADAVEVVDRSVQIVNEAVIYIKEKLSTVSVRYRTNVSRTSKGYSVECTVDATGLSKGEIILETKALMAMLEKAFPKEEGAV